MRIWVAAIMILIGCLLLTQFSQDRASNAAKTECRDSSVAQLKVIFDHLDSQVNNGDGYKDYLNPDGFPTGALLAWSESYLMQAYAEMFRATGDEKYLDKLSEHVKSVLNNRDDYRGELDYKGDLVPAWGTNRFTKNGAWKHFVAHTGMITYPMLEFVFLVREHGVSRLSAQAEGVLEKVEESIRYHDDQWVVQEAGYGLYVYREDFYHKPNYVCPLSQQAVMGRSLLLLGELTGSKVYLRQASDIATAIKASLQDNGNEGYVWGVFVSDKQEDTTVADISHSTATIDFAMLAYQAGIVFDQTDMGRFARTVKALWQNGRVPRYIDGTGDYTYEIAAGQYAFLAQFDLEIWDLCHDLLFKMYKVDIIGRYLQEDWWGTVMLSIARLACFLPLNCLASTNSVMGADI